MILFFPSRSSLILYSSFEIKSTTFYNSFCLQSAQFACKSSIAARIYSFLLLVSLSSISLTFYWRVKGIWKRYYWC